jgi:hypothetical protein
MHTGEERLREREDERILLVALEPTLPPLPVTFGELCGRFGVFKLANVCSNVIDSKDGKSGVWLMDEDPRFPNRKKKRDWDDMSALDKPVNAGGQTEEQELPVNVYRVVSPAQKTKEEELAERAELYAHLASVEATQQLPAADLHNEQDSVYHAPEPPPAQVSLETEKKAGVRKFFESQTRVFAAIGVALGILLGVIVAGMTFFMGTPNGRYDLGSTTSSAAGLKGHLFVEWDKKLNYRLTIEPDDAARNAAFAAAVASSPHPLSMEIHLQDSGGFVLCSREILLKYDARNAIELAPPEAEPQGGKPDAQAAKTEAQGAKTSTTTPPTGQPSPTVDFSQTDAQEAAREKGKEIFKNQVGPDGQITGLSAQGEMPCTAKAYEKAVAWSFSPNFPAIAEQNQLVERQQAIANPAPPPAADKSGARKKAAAAAKVVQKPLGFTIEGDDAIVDFDTSRGIIETNAGKIFFIDKAGGTISDPRWQDYPVTIHYRCDRSSECFLMHAGTGALHVRLRR